MLRLFLFQIFFLPTRRGKRETKGNTRDSFEILKLVTQACSIRDEDTLAPLCLEESIHKIVFVTCQDISIRAY